jgi:RNA polymerase sigma-70 factor, ECF subfamily
MTDWDAIVSRHLDAVRCTVHRLVGNHADAWDCVQDTFLEAVRIERRKPIHNWASLLRHLATNRALDLLRRRCRRQSRFDSGLGEVEPPGREPSPSASAESQELAERLRVAVGRLPRRQAEVFCLACFEEMNSEEISERLGVSPTAVRMLLSRARQRLHRLLEASRDAVQRVD